MTGQEAEPPQRLGDTARWTTASDASSQGSGPKAASACRARRAAACSRRSRPMRCWSPGSDRRPRGSSCAARHSARTVSGDRALTDVPPRVQCGRPIADGRGRGAAAPLALYGRDRLTGAGAHRRGHDRDISGCRAAAGARRSATMWTTAPRSAATARARHPWPPWAVRETRTSKGPSWNRLERHRKHAEDAMAGPGARAGDRATTRGRWPSPRRRRAPRVPRIRAG